MEWNKDEVMDVFAKCERLVGKSIVNDALTFDYEDDIWFVAGYDGTIYACMVKYTRLKSCASGC